MEERIVQCVITYNCEQITITGLANNIVINCSADINITPLVEELVITLDFFDKIKCEFRGFDTTDKKHDIIKNAISCTFDAFNEAVSTNEQSDQAVNELL